MSFGLEPFFAIGFVVLTLGSLWLIWELAERGRRLTAMCVVVAWLTAFSIHEAWRGGDSFYSSYRLTTGTTAEKARVLAESESPLAQVVKWGLAFCVVGAGITAGTWWYLDRSTRRVLAPWSAAQPGELEKLERLIADSRYDARFGGATRPMAIAGERLMVDGVEFDLAEAVLVANQRNPRLTLKEGFVVDFIRKDLSGETPAAGEKTPVSADKPATLPRPKKFSPDDLPPEMQF